MERSLQIQIAGYLNVDFKPSTPGAYPCRMASCLRVPLAHQPPLSRLASVPCCVRPDVIHFPIYPRQSHGSSCRVATNPSSPSRGGGGPAGCSIFYGCLVSILYELQRRMGGDIRESSGRALSLPARSLPAQCMTAVAGARRCSSMCRGGCWSSTPSSSCRGVPCRHTWPGAAQVLVGCGVCRPVDTGIRLSLRTS